MYVTGSYNVCQGVISYVLGVISCMLALGRSYPVYHNAL